MWISGAWVKIEICRGVYQGHGATPGGPELNLKATEVGTVSGAWANNGPAGQAPKVNAADVDLRRLRQD